MGQYYKPVFKRKGRITVCDNYLEGEEYNGMKLMEHSYYGNRWVDTIATKLYKTKCNVAWIGDYSDNPDELFWEHQEDITYDFVWGKEKRRTRLPYDAIGLKDKFLINHTKKLYINMGKYIKKAEDKDGYVIHPLPLLTAVGNGKGGGDYWGIYEELVGTWAWDTLSIEDKPLKDYKELDIMFNDDIPKGGV
jgi:hypothetical protein